MIGNQKILYFDYELMKKLNSDKQNPFSGSATTGISAYLLDRKFIEIEQEQQFIDDENKISMKQKVREQISLI